MQGLGVKESESLPLRSLNYSQQCVDKLYAKIPKFLSILYDLNPQTTASYNEYPSPLSKCLRKEKNTHLTFFVSCMHVIDTLEYTQWTYI